MKRIIDYFESYHHSNGGKSKTNKENIENEDNFAQEFPNQTSSSLVKVLKHKMAVPLTISTDVKEIVEQPMTSRDIPNVQKCDNQCEPGIHFYLT